MLKYLIGHKAQASVPLTIGENTLYTVILTAKNYWQLSFPNKSNLHSRRDLQNETWTKTR